MTERGGLPLAVGGRTVAPEAVRRYGMTSATRGGGPDDGAAASASPPESSYRLLVQSVQDYAIFTLDTEGRIASWNIGAARIKGYQPHEIIGQHFSVFYPAEQLASGKPAEELRIATAEGRLEDEGWRVRKDGSWFWAHVVITALRDEAGVLRGFGKVTRDLTRSRDAEHALSERRRLLAHLVEAQEVERRRIAWDVHDDSIQSMVAIGMRLQLLAAQLPPEHAAAVNHLDEAVRGAIGRLRNLVYRVRPPAIDRGLVETFASYLNQVVAGWGLEYTLHHAVDPEPAGAAAVTVFRIAQEALTNVHKHARATRIEVRLTSARNGLLVQVIDDGVGTVYPATGDQDYEHFGLIEMRERAEMAGGWWTMRSTPGAGTTVEFWVPTPAPGDTTTRP